MKMRFFILAQAIAKKSNHSQHKIGSVIIKKNRLISVGWNQLKTHSKSPHKYKSVHSEFHAILGVDPADLVGATIYVYRENKAGNPSMARPCPSCYSMLKSLGLSRVYYTHFGNYMTEAL